MTHGGREALIHSKMQRKCSKISPSPLVGLYGIFEDDCERHDILILEHMGCGDLFDAVVQTQRDVATIVYDIALALQQCHSAGCVHGDIKSENIMVDRSGRMKLADFGWSFHVGEDDNDDEGDDDEPCDRELMGTEEFRAPEVWKYAGRRQRLGPEVDMWSLGVVAYELMFGCLPFEGDDARYWWKRPLFRAASGSVGVEVDAEGVSLVKGLLRRNVQRRLTAECVLADGWIMKFGRR